MENKTTTCRPRVMFVDDDMHLLHGLKRNLRHLSQSHELVFHADPRSALQDLSENQTQVVVSDMQMPGLDGASLLEEIRRMSPATVRIILSGQPQSHSILRAIQNAHQYLTKPYDTQQLEGRLQKLTQGSCARTWAPLHKVITERQSLPAPSDAFCALIQELSSQGSSLERCNTLVSENPALAAKILQVVGNGFFGPPRTDGKIRQAVEQLGIEKLRELTMASAVCAPSDTGYESERLRRLYRRSALFSRLTRKIAEMDGASAGLNELLASAALLSNIAESLDPAAPPEATVYLLNLWGIAPAVTELVSAHWAPTPEQARSLPGLDILHLARVLLDETPPTGAKRTALHPEVIGLARIHEQAAAAAKEMKRQENA